MKGLILYRWHDVSVIFWGVIAISFKFYGLFSLRIRVVYCYGIMCHLRMGGDCCLSDFLVCLLL